MCLKSFLKDENILLNDNMLKKIFFMLIIISLIGSVWAQNENIVNINGIDFEIPGKYAGGELTNTSYEFDDEFEVSCIDGNIPKRIGLWACEKDYGENLTLENHPVRHYYQYNEYVHDNQSHAFFAIGKSIYEIAWTGNDLTSEIKNLIINTPSSEIDNDTFNNILDESIDIYKRDKIDQLNHDSEYNYLESKYNSKISSDSHEDTKLNEILLTRFH